VICPNCSSVNEAGAKFCNECGASLSSGCPNCGAINKPGARFCNECGTALTAGTGAATPPAGVAQPAAGSPSSTPVAERRLVTILFADIVGFTPFAAERDAEEVRDTLSRYFDMCSEVIARYGGTVEKFIGDAVMAVWGAPVAHEDDAERAVRAALELVDAVSTLGAGVQARAGVLTGEAAVTIGATNQGLVAGDLVNTASRLQSVAPAGSVLVGETTYRAASSAIAFEDAGEQTLKGKESPVPAWRALRVVAERGGRNRRNEGLEAPFVGRADELRLLKDLLQATGREQRARLVSVMGPAGIGKSRLAWEFLKYIDGLVETIYWHSGRSPAYGEGITFWALGEMVRGRCDLVEGDDEATTRRKVSETVAQWITDDEERRWVERALLTLLGAEAGMPPEQLFAAWRTFFERISAAGTVVLVFEDLHHADMGTLDFIDHVLEWSRGAPLYLVTLARPELLDRRQDWGARKRSFTSVFLEPLPEPQMRELLAGLAPGLPDKAVAAIVDRADGIPLYAVETVRMLVADGRLREEEGAYVPVGDLSALAVPDTLTALISSRLDALDAADRSLIHDAAVLGQSFTAAGLAYISGMAERELEDRLAVLVRRELLARDIDPRSAVRGQFIFVQALIREVAYNTLSRRDRKSRHLSAARYFEQVGSDELASALAGHYLAAHDNAQEGAEADVLAAQARIALKAAGERASALGANDQAVAFFEQALAISADAHDQAELHERAGESARHAGNYDVAQAHLRAAIDLYRDGGHRARAAHVTADFGWVLLDARRNQIAREILEQGLAEYADEPDGLYHIKRVSVRALEQNDEHERAIAAADEVLQIAEHRDDVAVIAGALVGKGAALSSLGRLHEGIALVRAAEALARSSGLDEILAIALLVGGAHLGEIDMKAALVNTQEALVLARRLSRRTSTLLAINNLGYTSFVAGDWDGAVAELDSALDEDMDVAQRIWLTSNSLDVHACRGEDVSAGLAQLDALVVAAGNEKELRTASREPFAWAALAAGDLEEARRLCLEIANLNNLAPAALYQAARCALWAGDSDGVAADLAALDATGFHGRIVEARRMTLRAGLAACGQREGEALRLYREALDAWRDVGMTWDEAQTAIDMAVVLDPSLPEVRAATEAGRETMVRLRSQPFIDRLDAAMARPPATDILVTERSAGEQISVESA